ncbi:hypothetical protein [Sphingobium sp. R-21]|uniref:hypothetical protein n=1 Tax=Sphingobium sp. R-21 TaxID=3404056 RepID=UPI003CFAF55E
MAALFHAIFSADMTWRQTMEDAHRAAVQVAALTDAQLIAIWAGILDTDEMTEEQRAVIDEMERRNLDF